MISRLSQSNAYWIAFIILGLWATFAFYTMHSLISSQQKFGKLINLSGKQRMLSQKTSLHAHIIDEKGTEHETLIKLVNLMKTDHYFITSNLTSETLQKYYFEKNGLDFQVKHYFNLLDSFLLDQNKKLLEEITHYSFMLLKTWIKL